MRKVTFVLALGAMCASILSGCKSKSRYKTPTTPFDKVSVALNGVEKSIENYKSSERTNSSSKQNRSIKRIAQSDTSGALSDIAALYTSYDSQGDKIDDLEYSQPPMVQFQCLKKVFEAVGKDFSFGTKYTDSINGVVYFDPATGDKKEVSSTYKYDYNFTMSISLDIDSNDLITADVSFKIDLSQGNTTLQTNWYVALSLDYEMSKESPTYTLSMFTDNEESDLSYLEYGNTYEYDYVDMKDGRINEWRKFCYEVNKRMVKDATHSTFADYSAEPDFKGQIGASKWYKNADLRKISHPNTSKTKKFIGALFDKFGLNTTDINGAAFINKNGVQNSAIKQVYNEFSSIFGTDAIYALITGNEGHEQQKVKTTMRVMDDSVNSEINHITLSEDTTLRTLFNGEEGNFGIWYFDENGEALEQVEDFDTVQFFFTIPYGSSGEEKVFGNDYLDTDISKLYEELGRDYYDERQQNAFYAYLRIRDKLSSLHAVIEINTVEALQEQIVLYFKGIFPSEVLSLGFPKYEGANCLFEFKDDIQTYLDITQTTQTELNAFKTKLESDAGKWSKEETQSSVRYTKLVNSTLLEMEINATSISTGAVRIFYKVTQLNKVEWPREAIKTASNDVFDLVAPTSLNGYFVTDEENPGTITLKNFTSSEQEAFIASLEACGEKSNIRENSIFVLKNNHVYQFGLIVGGNEIFFDYTVSSRTDFAVCELYIEKDGVLLETISLNNELTGYSLKQEFEPGVYKVKKHNLATDNETYVPINGATLECYANNVSYDEGSSKLTVINTTMIDFRMTLNDINQVELFDLAD